MPRRNAGVTRETSNLFALSLACHRGARGECRDHEDPGFVLGPFEAPR